MQPYFYIIEHIKTNKYYVGSKFGKNSNPKLLLKPNGYNTSSKTIRKIIEKEGLNSFKIRKIKIFDLPEEAYIYETRFLRKVKASSNKRFFNRHNNERRCPGTFDYEKYMMENYGVKNNMQSPELHKRFTEKFFEKYGVINPSQIPEVKKKIENTMMKKYGAIHNFSKGKTRDKFIADMIKEYGVDNCSKIEYVKEKKKKKAQERYGVNCVFQSEEVKKKIENTMMKKYGYINPGQSTYLKEKHSKRLKENHERPIVKQILQYTRKYKIKLGQGWPNKKIKDLEIILEKLVKEYGLMN